MTGLGPDSLSTQYARRLAAQAAARHMRGELIKGLIGITVSAALAVIWAVVVMS